MRRNNGGEPSDIFHVMARGNNRRQIFRDDLDRRRFLDLMAKSIQQRKWLSYAYCLMGNHVHFLIGAPSFDVSDGMRDVLSTYARRFNARHGRTGHLFQERHRAVNVTDEGQLLTTFRYIATNPVRAGLAAAPSDWEWSSYAGLIRGAEDPCVSESDVLPIFHPIPRRARVLMADFVCQATSEDRRPSLYALAQVLPRGILATTAVRMGWTHREVAGVLGVTRSAVSKEIVRSVRLRTGGGDEGPIGP